MWLTVISGRGAGLASPLKGTVLIFRKPPVDGSTDTESQGTDVYGPNGVAVRAVVDRLRNATTTEVAHLGDKAECASGESWERAERAAWDATWMSGRVSIRDLAVDEAKLVSVIVGIPKRSEAVEGAVGAAVVGDLIGQHGYTHDHHRTLTGPWRSVMGVWNGSSWLRQVA